MSKKPGKRSPETSKKADQAANSGHSANKKATGKPLRRPAEGPDNLRQRAEWFSRRAGSGNK